MSARKPKKRAKMSFADWKAMGPDKAAVYLCKMRGYGTETHRKLKLILQEEWK